MKFLALLFCAFLAALVWGIYVILTDNGYPPEE